MTAATPRALPEMIALPAPGAALTIARDPGSGVDVVLDDRSITRKPHLRLERAADGTLTAIDLTGEQGLAIEGERRERGDIPPGTRLRIGDLLVEREESALRLMLERDGVAIRLDGATVDVETESGVRRLLDRVSLELPRNRLIGIIGPSGAGKSTLLRTIAAEQSLSRGHITVSDHRGPLGANWTRTSLGFVPQDDAVHARLTVEESLTHAARLRLPGCDADQRRARVDDVLARLGLDAAREQRIETLSGGQRKRVNVGHELLAGPRLLCLDEPTAGLDPWLERELMQDFRRLARRGGTVLVTTHVTGSLDLLDEVIVLAEGGRVAWQGPPSGLLETFGVERLAELYPRLSGEAAAEFAPDSPEAPAEPPSSLRRAEAPPSFLHQWQAVVRRDLRLSFGELRPMLATFALPLVVGLGIRLALPDLVDRDGVLFFGVVAMLWFGLQAASLEIVRERAIFERERRTGLSPAAFLLAKWSVTGLAGLGQALIMVLAFHLDFQDEGLRGLPSGLLPAFLDGRGLELDAVAWLLLWVGQLVGAGLGLGISASVRSERQATLTVPLLVIPMLLFSARGMAASDRLGFLREAPPGLPREWLAAINPARQVYELLYAALIRSNSGLAYPSPGEAAVELGLLVLLPLLALGLAWWQISRRRRSAVMHLGERTLPELDDPALGAAERGRVLLAARVFLDSGRCPRCGYRATRDAPCPHCRVAAVISADAAESLRGGGFSGEILRGMSYLPRGLWHLIRTPRLYAVAAIPILLNVGVVLAAFALARRLAAWLGSLGPETLADWDAGLWRLLRVGAIAAAHLAGELSVLFVPLAAALLFATVGRTLLMPLMELLAESATDLLHGKPEDQPFDLARVAKNALRGLLDAVVVMILQLVLLVLFLPLAWIPLVGPLLWFTLPPASTAAIDLLDLNLIVRHYGPREKVRLLWRRKGRIFGLGLAFFLCLEAPWLNLILGMVLLPAATVGSALLYVELDER